MNIESFRTHCITKKGVTEHFPFDEDTLVFKVMGKMFALSSLKKWEEGSPSVNLKCDPDRALKLRAKYEAVQPGFHMNKKLWNTVAINEELPDEMILELIDHSYDLIVAGLTKKLQAELANL